MFCGLSPTQAPDPKGKGGLMSTPCCIQERHALAQPTSTWREGGFSEFAQRCCLFVCQVEQTLHEDKDNAGNIPSASPGPLATVLLPAAPPPGGGR